MLLLQKGLLNCVKIESGEGYVTIVGVLLMQMSCALSSDFNQVVIGAIGFLH